MSLTVVLSSIDLSIISLTNDYILIFVRMSEYKIKCFVFATLEIFEFQFLVFLSENWLISVLIYPPWSFVEHSFSLNGYYKRKICLRIYSSTEKFSSQHNSDLKFTLPPQ